MFGHGRTPVEKCEKTTSFRFSLEGRRLLESMADTSGQTLTGVLELAIRREAMARGLGSCVGIPGEWETAPPPSRGT